jgi:hypothetical protein
MRCCTPTVIATDSALLKVYVQIDGPRVVAHIIYMHLMLVKAWIYPHLINIGCADA